MKYTIAALSGVFLLFSLCACANAGARTPVPPTAVSPSAPAPSGSPTLASVANTAEPTFLPPQVINEPTPRPTALITFQNSWDVLINLEYPNRFFPNGKAQMQNGVARAQTPDGEVIAGLFNNRTYDDMDRDQDNDAAVVMGTQVPNVGSIAEVVLIRNENGAPKILPPVMLGGGLVVLRHLIVDHGTLTVEFDTESAEANSSSADTRVRQVFEIQNDALKSIRREEISLVGQSPMEAEPPAHAVAFPAGVNKVTYTREIDSRQIHRYVIDAAQGQILSVRVETESGDAVLGIFGAAPRVTLLSLAQREQNFRGVVPHAQVYTILVVPISGESEKYILNIELTPTARDAPTPTAPPAQPTPLMHTLRGRELLLPAAQPQDKRLYLSFDDGPSKPYSHAILEVLSKYNAKATFFMVGQQVASRRDVMQEILDRGNTIGNHTWNHQSFQGMDHNAFLDQVNQTSRAFDGKGTNCLRPPGGATDAFTRGYAEELGYKIQLWNIDPVDWKRPGVDAIVGNVLTNARPGRILLMHDGGGNREQSIAALEQILSALAAQGYRFDEPLCTEPLPQ